MNLFLIASRVAENYHGEPHGLHEVNGHAYEFTNDHITDGSWLDAAEVAELEGISTDDVVNTWPNGDWRMMRPISTQA